jgi:hypothetical protein
MSSAWECGLHGAVHPFHAPVQPSVEAVEQVVRGSGVPAWLPWPLPAGWVVTGIAYAGDERYGGRATVVACSGPAPLGGGGDLLLIAEEPGVGLGARYAGLPGPDPGEVGEAAPAHAKLHAAGHPTAMWCVNGPPDRAVFVGEALARWLWAVLWPESAGCLLYEDIHLADLREAGQELSLLPFGALSPRLAVVPSD